MSTTRIMPGLENLEGRQFGTLRVTRMVRRNPEPSYATVCDKCSAESTATHTRLRNGAAVCLNSACGKTAKPTGRELLREQKRIAAERQAEAEQAALEASAARMAGESDGWERPTKYAPTPSEYQPTSERTRLELKAHREAEEAAEREAEAPRLAAERATAERIAQLTEEQQKMLRQLRSIEGERVATGKDGQFTVDAATVGDAAAVPASQVDGWHAAQSTQFLADNPSYFACRENEAAMLAYIERNAPGLKLLSAAQLTAAYKRLRDFGLLKERPAPVSKPTPIQAERVAEQPKPTGPKTYLGRDYLTGEERQFTEREVDRMSSTDYRRAFPVFDSVRDLFAAIGDAR